MMLIKIFNMKKMPINFKWSVTPLLSKKTTMNEMELTNIIILP